MRVRTDGAHAIKTSRAGGAMFVLLLQHVCCCAGGQRTKTRPDDSLCGPAATVSFYNQTMFGLVAILMRIWKSIMSSQLRLILIIIGTDEAMACLIEYALDIKLSKLFGIVIWLVSRNLMRPNVDQLL